MKKENIAEEKEGEEEIDDVVTNDYIGYLNIAKINLTKGFVDKKI